MYIAYKHIYRFVSQIKITFVLKLSITLMYHLPDILIHSCLELPVNLIHIVSFGL